eukprot:SAG22_NODE_89_length_21278_cov_16.698758_7_plen_53_part_00
MVPVRKLRTITSANQWLDSLAGNESWNRALPNSLVVEFQRAKRAEAANSHGH